MSSIHYYSRILSLLNVPDHIWELPEVTSALENDDFERAFHLISEASERSSIPAPLERLCSTRVDRCP